jgi:hypothetical protein
MTAECALHIYHKSNHFIVRELELLAVCLLRQGRLSTWQFYSEWNDLCFRYFGLSFLRGMPTQDLYEKCESNTFTRHLTCP